MPENSLPCHCSALEQNRKAESCTKALCATANQHGQAAEHMDTDRHSLTLGASKEKQATWTPQAGSAEELATN